MCWRWKIPQGNAALHAKESFLELEERKPGREPVKTIKLELPDTEHEAVGQIPGRCKLLEKVGEGGCGVVYVAEQTEPVRRRVALKVIKLCALGSYLLIIDLTRAHRKRESLGLGRFKSVVVNQKVGDWKSAATFI